MILIWAALAAAVCVPLAMAAVSPLLPLYCDRSQFKGAASAPPREAADIPAGDIVHSSAADPMATPIAADSSSVLFGFMVAFTVRRGQWSEPQLFRY